MSRNSTRDLYPSFVVLRDAVDLDKYDDATEAYKQGGSRRDLMTRLVALGMTANEIRWHADYPGRRMAALAQG